MLESVLSSLHELFFERKRVLCRCLVIFTMFYRNSLKSLTGSVVVLTLGSSLLSGCPSGGAAREAGERVVTGIVREGAERAVNRATREAQEQGTRKAVREAEEPGTRVLVSAIQVNNSIKESAETAAARRFEQIKENVEQRSQAKEAVVEILCDSQNFQELSLQVYDAAYEAAYKQGIQWSNQDVPVSEEQVKKIAISASSKVLSYYCKKTLNSINRN